MARLLPGALALLVALVGCSTSPRAGSDGALGSDVPQLGDVTVPPSDALVPIGSGFTTLDGVRAGVAPLEVVFLPVTRGSVTSYRWEFGDGTAPASEASPTHVFRLPGAYRVSLTVSGSAGSDTVSRDGYITVTTAPTGSPCDEDGQCQGGLCLCGRDAAARPIGCPPSLREGICSAPCGDLPCADGSVCVDLRRSAQGDLLAGREPWRRLACLAACDDQAGCAREGFLCRQLPAGAPNGGTPPSGPFVAGCLPTEPRDIGASCTDDEPSDLSSACLFGSCLAVGLHGLCSATCQSPHDCPPGTDCARFNADPTKGFCLAACTAPDFCPTAPGDPLLACERPQEAGAWGFTFDDRPLPGARYCSPRRCRDDVDCAIGRCGPDGVCLRPPLLLDGGPGDGGPDAALDGGGGDGGPADLGADPKRGDGGDGPPPID